MNTRPFTAALAVSAVLALGVSHVEARGGHGGGGHGGGGHGGGSYGGGGYRGPGAGIAPMGGGVRYSAPAYRGVVGVSHGGVPVHVPRYSPPLTVYPAPRIYAPVAPVYRPHVHVAPPVIYPPVVRYVPPPIVYVTPPVTTYVPAVQQYWYYCNDYQAYYPYVEQCPSEWVRVLPN